MKEKYYGDFKQTNVKNDIDLHVESILIKGYTIVPNLFTHDELQLWRKKIDDIYIKQESEFGHDALLNIQELDVCRAPLLYDFSFIKLATPPIVLEIVKKILGSWYILNLQNAIINRSKTQHHQSSWHRDLPYQNHVISKPLAINSLIAIDDFSQETGATQLIPFTHKLETLPSDAYIEDNHVIANMSAGSAILFDSMVLHRGGVNSSNHIRRGVNQLYTKPILKQQYDFPKALGNKENLDEFTSQLLGYTSQVPIDDKEWRNSRKNKKKS